MDILSEEQQKEIIADAMEQIKSAVVSEATRQITWDVKNEVGKQIHSIVEDFIQVEVAPELKKLMIENKSLITDAAVTSANEMAEMLAKSITAKMAENLGTSYKRTEIFKALFS